MASTLKEIVQFSDDHEKKHCKYFAGEEGLLGDAATTGKVIYALARYSAAVEKLNIPKSFFISLTEYFNKVANIDAAQTEEDGFWIYKGLSALSENNIAVPVFASLISEHIDSSDSKAILSVNVVDMMNNPVSHEFSITIASGPASAKGKKLSRSGVSYQIPVSELNLSAGTYKLGLLISTTDSATPFTPLEGNEVSFKISGKLSVKNIEVVVSPTSQKSHQKAVSALSATPSTATQTQYILFSFDVYHGAGPVANSLQQVVVRFSSKTRANFHVFFAASLDKDSKGAYTITLSLKDNIKRFDNTPGDYEVFLIVADSSADNVRCLKLFFFIFLSCRQLKKS